LVLLYQWLLKSGDFYFGDLGILRTAVTRSSSYSRKRSARREFKRAHPGIISSPRGRGMLAIKPPFVGDRNLEAEGGSQ
jgi:hypothetical protein